MKKGLNKKLLGIGAVLGVAYLATEGKKKADQESQLNNIFAGLPSGEPEQTEVNYLLDQIKNNAQVRAAVKALSPTGEQIVNQINQNVYNLENVQFQSIRNSIIDLLLLGNQLAYPNTSFTTDLLLGKKTISIDDSITIALPTIDLGRIYCIEGYFKTSASQDIYIFSKGVDGSNVNAFNGLNYVVVTTGINANYTRKRLYFSFSGTISEFSTLNLVIFKAAGTYTVSNLTFSEVGLGEAVPVNLPFLPKGQEVIDSTTGERGILTNEIVDWYTMS